MSRALLLLLLPMLLLTTDDCYGNLSPAAGQFNTEFLIRKLGGTAGPHCPRGGRVVQALLHFRTTCPREL